MTPFSSIYFAALPIGEYAAIALLVFFGLKSIKDAWDLPPTVAKKGGERGPELDEFVEAEELVKEKVIIFLLLKEISGLLHMPLVLKEKKKILENSILMYPGVKTALEST